MSASDPDTAPSSTISASEPRGAFDHPGFSGHNPQSYGFSSYSLDPNVTQQHSSMSVATCSTLSPDADTRSMHSEQFAPFGQDPITWGQQQQSPHHHQQQQQNVYGVGSGLNVGSSIQQAAQGGSPSFFPLPQREQRQQYIDPQALTMPMSMQMGHAYATGSQSLGWGLEQDPRLVQSSSSSPGPSQQGPSISRSTSQARQRCERSPAVQEPREQPEVQKAAYIRIEKPTRAMLNDVRDAILRHNGRASFQIPEI